MNIIITVRIFSDRLLFNSIFGQSFYTKVDIGQRSVVMLKQRLVRPSLRLEETVPVYNNIIIKVLLLLYG